MTKIQTKGETGVKCGQDDRTMRYGPGIMRAKRGGNISYHKLHAWRYGNNMIWRLWETAGTQTDGFVLAHKH